MSQIEAKAGSRSTTLVGGDRKARGPRGQDQDSGRGRY